jgi:hypothetical protein
MNINEPALARASNLRGWLDAATRRWGTSWPARPPARPDIAQEDWDLLFQAALERLQRIAVEDAEPRVGVRYLQLQPPGTVLGECIDALDQLRLSAARDRAK